MLSVQLRHVIGASGAPPCSSSWPLRKRGRWAPLMALSAACRGRGRVPASVQVPSHRGGFTADPRQLPARSLLLWLQVAVAKETALRRQSQGHLPQRYQSAGRPRPNVTPFSQEKIGLGLQGKGFGLFRREAEDGRLVSPDTSVSAMDA